MKKTAEVLDIWWYSNWIEIEEMINKSADYV